MQIMSVIAASTLTFHRLTFIIFSKSFISISSCHIEASIEWMNSKVFEVTILYIQECGREICTPQVIVSFSIYRYKQQVCVHVLLFLASNFHLIHSVESSQTLPNPYIQGMLRLFSTGKFRQPWHLLNSSIVILVRTLLDYSDILLIYFWYRFIH